MKWKQVVLLQGKPPMLRAGVISLAVTVLVTAGAFLTAYCAFYAKSGQGLPDFNNGVEHMEVIDAEKARANNGFLLEVPYISQKGAYPAACEAVSAVMVLSYYGYDISVDDFIDRCLSRQEPAVHPDTGLLTCTSPAQAFIGDPKSYGGYGCYAPVIVDALHRAAGDTAVAIDTTGTDIDRLLEQYVTRKIPVLLWASINLAPTYAGDSWILEETGQWYTWTAGEHCMVLVGADDGHYYFNDPYNGNGVVQYDRALVQKRWEELGKQSVVLIPTEA